MAKSIKRTATTATATAATATTATAAKRGPGRSKGSKNGGSKNGGTPAAAPSVPPIKKAAPPKPAAPADPPEMIILALSDVIVNEAENCRQRPENPERWRGFVAGIQNDGLRQPPGVQLRSDGYHLVFGYRRMCALLEIHGKTSTLAHPFMLVRGGKAEARIANGVENLSRNDLAPFEIATLLVDLKRNLKIPSTELAAKMGITDRYVDTLIRLREKLHSTVWAKFVEYGEKPPIAVFIKIVSLPQLEQPAAWEALMADKEEAKKAKKRSQAEAAIAGDGQEGKPGSDGRAATPAGNGIVVETLPEDASPGFVSPDDDDDGGEYSTPNRDDIIGCLALAADGEDSEEYHRGVAAALRWVIGQDDYPFQVD